MQRIGRLIALAFPLLSAPACSSIEAEKVPDIESADALWGGGGFCARTPRGLSCWASGSEPRPVVVEGIEHPREVALISREGCALDARGVACFQAGSPQSQRRPFDRPTQLVALNGYPGVLCVLAADGVSCWLGGESPRLLPEMGKPRALLPAVDDDALCAVEQSTLRCFEVNLEGQFRESFVLEDVQDAKAVMVDSTGGKAWVLDGTTLERAEGEGRIEVGNPFAAKDPLAVDVKLKPPVLNRLTPQAVPGFGPVRVLTVRAIHAVVLDKRGAVELDDPPGRVVPKIWGPPGTTPTGLWRGGADDFYVSQGTELRQMGWHKGDRIDRKANGVENPIHVVADIRTACVLEASGQVACFPELEN